MIERVFFGYISGSSKRSGRDLASACPGEGSEAQGEGGGSALDLSDLDLASIEFSEREMRALSGLTPALSRRLQRQLLASLPPRAARHLRRTLSLHAAPPPAPAPAPRAHSAERPPDDTPACLEPEPAQPPDPEPTIPEEPDRADHLQYSTLPRLRRRSTSREPASPAAPAEGRPLLSKYLTPERALSLEEPSAPDAEAGPARRHSLRLAGEGSRRRVSRFLRSDFFERPSIEESLYARHKKEKELETQRILREIREKRTRGEAGRTLDTPPPAPDDVRKCASPLGSLLGKERSRSNTPFLPSLDVVKETAPDAGAASAAAAGGDAGRVRARPADADSRLARPRSYPVKALDAIEEPGERACAVAAPASDAVAAADKRESRLMRPRSYPTTSPSPEKVYIERSLVRNDAPKDRVASPEVKTDVEVSFSITLPKRKVEVAPKADAVKIDKEVGERDEGSGDRRSTGTLVLKKYQIANGPSSERSDRTEHKSKNGSALANGAIHEDVDKTIGDSKLKVSKKDDSKKTTDSESNEKKGTIKKKIIRKVSSKSKTDLTSGQDAGDVKQTKKITKKVKEKPMDEDSSKSATVTKKKSVLQSIGHKLEKFASSKSSSPEKVAESSTNSDAKKNSSKIKRTQREQSVPVVVEPPSESNLIKRAVTITDVAALESQPPTNNKTTVSKVLGLFKKFEPKDKVKPIMEKSQSVDTADMSIRSEPAIETDIDSLDKDKPRRPTSLLLNGLGRKNKYGRTSSDSVSNVLTQNDDQPTLKKENETKNRNSLKLDFSKLPRVKKIVPTNPVIEPQLNYSSLDGETEKQYISEKIARALENSNNIDHTNSQSRSRSRSRSTISNSEIKSDLSAETKYLDKTPLSPSEQSTSHPLRNHESTSPEREDMADRIRRKSFYSRFNEKKQRRKSSLVGPGATEYDPLARIHAPPTPSSETKYEVSAASPGAYDLSPGLSANSDLSPSAERYRTLLSELPRTNLKYENYGLNDKIDTYRSLDRNDFRKYPGSRSYLDYDQPSTYTQRYSRTKSLLENAESPESSLMHSLRDPLKYNRTISMYSPGNYATYRPKRTHNPAIILKENEKEPSPENILDKIRQRKNFSISVTRKPDRDTESVSRCVCLDFYMSRK